MATANVRMSQVTRANDKLVKLLEKAATQEPKSGGADWVRGSRGNMTKVVTFKTEGREKGSLERFAEANKLGKPVYEALRNAVAYGAHAQDNQRGLLTFVVSKPNLARLEDRLNDLYARRDVDGNGVLDRAEQADAKKTKNGASTLKALEKINAAKTRGLRSELTFSKQVNYVIDLLYGGGNINGPGHVARITADLPKVQAEAVERAYAAVSRYISRGRSGALPFICQDQRREVQRGLMRVFGASLDATEKAISALKLPAAYR